MKHKRWIDPRDPDYEAPEGYCPSCQDWTTLINNQGECQICGTEVQEHAQ